MIIVRNKLTTICVAFTIITAISSVGNLAAGFASDTHVHLIMRLVICAIAIGSLYVFEWLERLPELVVTAIHFLGTLGLVFALVWLYGLFGELHPNAYRDIFFNYLAAYIVFSIFLWLKSRRARNTQ